ncbi:MAG: PAC2 family protein [Chloroflexi bacterium]|nr:PAC2 family protein [Chloroflexota bacterium]MBM4451104.1 PAC2 family protein [Chloroflexota bacterium]MBM4454248.1 PAC2 family protein [Chloroflexota bacterium]
MILANKQTVKILKEPALQSSSLVVGWSEDAGKLGGEVIGYLKRKLGAEEFAEIELECFFPLGGVGVEDDVAQYPESKFYCCSDKNLVLLGSTPPRFDWYQFLTSVLDVAQNLCHVKEVYTIGGMISPGAHTTPRLIMPIVSSKEMKMSLNEFGVNVDMDYETPPGQRPTLSSYLLWAAKGRGIPGASLWVPVPFYLVSSEDPRAWKRVIEFLDNRLGLGIDYGDLNNEIAEQNKKIAQLTGQVPELGSYIQKLETNLALSSEEGEKLAKEVEDFLKKRE